MPLGTDAKDAGVDGGLRDDDAIDGGFTIIELLVVVVVSGILIGLVLLSVNEFQENGVTAACRSEIDSLNTANVAYRNQHGTDAADVAILLSRGYLERAPRYVTFSNGTTNPATADGCEAQR